MDGAAAARWRAVRAGRQYMAAPQAAVQTQLRPLLLVERALSEEEGAQAAAE